MKTLQISEETYEKIKEQLEEEEKFEINALQDFVGKSFFFRTVTYHIIGKVVKVLPMGILQLEKASWVADSGRFTQAIQNGILDEVEPIGDGWFISLATCTDFGFWKHSLDIQQK
jgi:hypothetical protein